jgi:ubiquinone/menaquinone biosynthesis C-methylase UbiE
MNKKRPRLKARPPLFSLSPSPRFFIPSIVLFFFGLVLLSGNLMYDMNMSIADYNDENYDYLEYWKGREYENNSEFMALRKLLPSDFSENKKAIDVGGGFGRLLPVLKEQYDDITIFDYSSKLLDSAKKYGDKLGVNVKTIEGDVNHISETIGEKYDCVIMIRVSHHLDNLEEALKQINGILNENGIFILEIANKMHFKSVVKNFFKGNFKYFNKKPVSVATKNVTFLNYHPKYVENIFEKFGYTVEKKLSVSNFRHRFFKKVFPMEVLLFKENLMQNIGAPLNFGPSIFYKLTVNKGGKRK